MVSFTLNGQKVTSEAEADTPLLWVIRDEFGLKGTRFGCGIAQCGACTVHIDGQPLRSCSARVGDLEGANITTIEGLDPAGQHPLQIAWIETQVPQCGYCQSGQIMQAANLLANNPTPTDEQIVNHMTGNLCRCMSYNRIHQAIRNASDKLKESGGAS